MASPGLERDCAVRLPDLLDRNQAFELVAEIDDDFLRSDFDDVALQQLPFGGRREMAIVLDEMLVIFFAREVYVTSLFIRAAGHAQNSDKPLKHQYFRTIPDLAELVNPSRPGSRLTPVLVLILHITQGLAGRVLFSGWTRVRLTTPLTKCVPAWSTMFWVKVAWSSPPRSRRP